MKTIRKMYLALGKGLIRLAYLDTEKLDKPPRAKSYTAHTWGKGAY